MANKVSVKEASLVMRDAMRDAVKRYSIWYLIQAALMIVAGVIALIYPLFSAAVLAVFLGWVLIVAGGLRGIGLIGASEVPNFWLQLVSVALALIVGLLLVMNPDAALATVTLMLIIYFLVEGISRVTFALSVRPLQNWGWVLLTGVLGILLSIFLLANPGMAIWLLGLFIGLQLIADGIAVGTMAWAARKS
ncbi:MAG: HdeD family acid-resistance protein [Kiloniellales bacterium]